MHNIEKSAFRKGEYVGYADGVWNIRRTGRKSWLGYCRENPAVTFTAGTLKELSELLATYAEAQRKIAANQSHANY